MSLVRPLRPLLDWSRGGEIPLDLAEQAFFAEKRRIGKESTARNYRRVFRAFRSFLATRHPEYCPDRACRVAHPARVAALSPEVLTAYADWLERREPLEPGRVRFQGARLAPASVSGYLRPLRTLCIYLAKKGALAADPFALTVDPLIREVEATPLKLATPADLARIVDAIRGDTPLALRDRALVVLGGDTGQRTGELARLRLAEVELARSRLVIRGPKNGRDWVLALNPPAVEALARYLALGRPALAAAHARHGRDDLGYVFLADPRPHGGQQPLPGGQLSENGLYQVLSRRWRAAGGAGRFGFHRLRHMVGTQIGERGTVKDVMERLNHKSERSALPYMHPSPQHVAGIVQEGVWDAVAAARVATDAPSLRVVHPASDDAHRAA